MKVKKGYKFPVRVIVIVIGVMAMGLWVGYRWGRDSVPVVDLERYEKLVVINEVRTANSLLEVMQKKYLDGEIGLPQARALAKELVEGMSYGKNGEGVFVVTATTESGKLGWRVTTKGYAGD